MIGDDLVLSPENEVKGKFLIILKDDDIEGVKTHLTVGVYRGDTLIEEMGTFFIAPYL